MDCINNYKETFRGDGYVPKTDDTSNGIGVVDFVIDGTFFKSHL